MSRKIVTFSDESPSFRTIPSREEEEDRTTPVRSIFDISDEDEEEDYNTPTSYSFTPEEDEDERVFVPSSKTRPIIVSEEDLSSEGEEIELVPAPSPPRQVLVRKTVPAPTRSVEEEVELVEAPPTRMVPLRKKVLPSPVVEVPVQLQPTRTVPLRKKVVEEELVAQEPLVENIKVPATKTVVVDRKVVPSRTVIVEEDEIVTTTQTRTPSPKRRVRVVPAAAPPTRTLRVEEEVEVVRKKVPHPAQTCPVSSPPLPARVVEEEVVLKKKVGCATSQIARAVVTTHPVEEILKRYGYTCSLKLASDTDEGGLFGHYIKCLDPLGNAVYVKPDLKDSYVTVEVTDRKVILSKDGIAEIPYSTRKTYLELATSECCGVAIEASCGVCFLSQKKEEHFMYGVAPIPSKCGTAISAVLDAVPIVSLCDIKANPSQVLQNTEIVTARILNKTYAVCCADLKVYADSINALVGQTRVFQEKESRIADKLIVSTNFWRNEAKKAIASSGTCDAAAYRARHATIMFNLERRNMLRVELARICRTVGFLSARMEEARRTLCELERYMDSEFCGISGQLVRR